MLRSVARCFPARALRQSALPTPPSPSPSSALLAGPPDVTMRRKSRRRATTFFRMPNSTSVFRLRSCASSMMTALYLRLAARGMRAGGAHAASTRRLRTKPRPHCRTRWGGSAAVQTRLDTAALTGRPARLPSVRACAARARGGGTPRGVTTPVQVRFGERLAQQHAVSHVLYDGVGAGAVLKADVVAHLAARAGAGGQTARSAAEASRGCRARQVSSVLAALVRKSPQAGEAAQSGPGPAGVAERGGGGTTQGRRSSAPPCPAPRPSPRCITSHSREPHAAGEACTRMSQARRPHAALPPAPRLAPCMGPQPAGGSARVSALQASPAPPT